MDLPGSSHSHITVVRRFYDSEEIHTVAKRIQAKTTHIDKEVMLTRYYQDTNLQAVKRNIAGCISQLELAKWKVTRVKVEHQGSPLCTEAKYWEGHIKLKIPVINQSIDWYNLQSVNKIALEHGGRVAGNVKESTDKHSIRFINFKFNTMDELVNKTSNCANWLEYSLVDTLEVKEVKIEAVVLDMHLNG